MAQGLQRNFKKRFWNRTTPVPELEHFYFQLNRDSSTNVIARLALTLVGGRRYAGADDVKQGLADFPGTRTNYLTLFIFKNINPACRIEGKNHRPRVHCDIVSRVRSFVWSCGYFDWRPLNRRRSAPAVPTSPLPRSNKLAGSGTSLLGWLKPPRRHWLISEKVVPPKP